jgi:FKBP-type peptidyl-prolyl cis-trans isomerase SlyD
MVVVASRAVQGEIMNTVAKNCVVTLSYDVTDTDGVVVDPGEAPLRYLHGGYEDIFPVIEEALEGKCVGETVTVKLQPDQAYGEYDADLVQIEPIDSLPQPVAIGMQIEGAPEGEPDATVFYRVTEIAEGKVVLDGNHPLAGMALVFTATVTAVRPASPTEISSGKIE